LDVAPVALPGYSPHLKGGIERFWRFLKTSALAPLPGYIDAGHDLRGNYLLAASALGETALVNALATWVDWYNTEHVHRTLGSTPLEAWGKDEAPLRAAPADQLWQDFLISAQHKVGKLGVRFRKTDYVGVNGELAKVFGRTVEVRYLPHDKTFIEVFDEGQHVGTCYPAHLLQPDDIEAFLEARRKAEREARAAFRSSNRLRQDRDDAVPLAKVTGPGGRTRYEIAAPPEIDLFNGGDEALKQLNLLPQDDMQGRLL
jgi:putative transposase